jgi:hypothetical protein
MVVVVGDDFQRFPHGEGNCIPSRSAAMSLGYYWPPWHEYVSLERRLDHLVFNGEPSNIWKPGQTIDL